MFVRILIIIFIAFISVTSFASEAVVILSVPFSPVPVPIFGNKTAIVYELNIENHTNTIIKPLAIDVNDNSNTTLIEYTGFVLDHNMKYSNAHKTIAPDQKATLFVWIALPDNQDIPRKLTHQMAYSVNEHDDDIRVTSIDASINIQIENNPDLNPPLSGGPWLASGIQ